jgi:hypothetical protein
MYLFAAAFALHVLGAILGVGPVVAIAIVSSRGPTTAWAARRRLRRNESVALAQGIRFVARTSWLMCASVAVITLLMTLRPG